VIATAKVDGLTRNASGSPKLPTLQGNLPVLCCGYRLAINPRLTLITVLPIPNDAFLAYIVYLKEAPGEGVRHTRVKTTTVPVHSLSQSNASL
jgi:hypothetical protein